MTKLKNCVIVIDDFGDKCLFGEVYNDSRFKEGHHVLTSKLESLDKDKKVGITRTGSRYEILNFMTHEELIKYIETQYKDEHYKRYLISIIK